VRFCGAESEINALITAPADPLRERYECLVVNVVDGLETHGVRAEFGANRIVDGLCKRCCIFPERTRRSHRKSASSSAPHPTRGRVHALRLDRASPQSLVQSPYLPYSGSSAVRPFSLLLGKHMKGPEALTRRFRIRPKAKSSPFSKPDDFVRRGSLLPDWSRCRFGSNRI